MVSRGFRAARLGFDGLELDLQLRRKPLGEIVPSGLRPVGHTLADCDDPQLHALRAVVFLAAVGRLPAGLPAVVVALRAADLADDFAPLSATLTIGNFAGAAGFLAAVVLAGALLDVVFAAVLAGTALAGPRVDVLRVAGLAVFAAGFLSAAAVFLAAGFLPADFLAGASS